MKTKKTKPKKFMFDLKYANSFFGEQHERNAFAWRNNICLDFRLET